MTAGAFLVGALPPQRGAALARLSYSSHLVPALWALLMRLDQASRGALFAKLVHQIAISASVSFDLRSITKSRTMNVPCGRCSAASSLSSVTTFLIWQVDGAPRPLSSADREHYPLLLLFLDGMSQVCTCPAPALHLPCICPASALHLPCICPASALHLA